MKSTRWLRSPLAIIRVCQVKWRKSACKALKLPAINPNIFGACDKSPLDIDRAKFCKSSMSDTSLESLRRWSELPGRSEGGSKPLNQASSRMSSACPRSLLADSMGCATLRCCSAVVRLAASACVRVRSLGFNRSIELLPELDQDCLVHHFLRSLEASHESGWCSASLVPRK